ncbi:MAG TPA: sensor histidine kinase [Roseiflexaceae bacterium]|nr:sensor histidine kinase [Roseiflexaceae bacterium]
MRRVLNWIRVGVPATIIVAFVILRVAVVHTMEQQQSSYVERQGMWPAFEQERLTLLLRETVHRISLGDTIPDEQYLLREDLAMSRTAITLAFFQRQPWLPPEQQATLRRIDERTAEYRRITGRTPPDPTTARRLLPLLDDLISSSHELVNNRREAMFVDMRATFDLLDRIRLFEILIGLCLLLSAVWITHLERQANRRLHMLMLQGEDLAVEQERNRLAREIHDGLGHHLHNTHLYLTLAEQAQRLHPDEMAKAMGVARQEASAAQTELYRALEALHTNPANNSDLAPLVQELVRDCRLSGLEATFAVWGDPHPLPPQVHHALYRIIQEALTNVQRHAMADHAQIELDYRTPHQVQLRVADDGVGMQGEQQCEGHGLRNMRARVALLKGQIQITAQSPQGMNIWIMLPIR